MERPTATDRRAARVAAPALALALILATLSAAGPVQEVGPQPRAGGEIGLLKLLGIDPSSESIDYVSDKTQFQLHTLLTEQRHPKTWNLSERIAGDTAAGLRMLLAVDEDVTARLGALAADPSAIERAAAAAEEAIGSGGKIYIYGCGATGRLAKQMESALWRPFWGRVKADEKTWKKAKAAVPDDIGDRLIGEMTGGDRALISSLEGFEDLQLIGRLQLEDRGVARGDVVICVTEGGETSSVIGTILAAHDLWKAAPGYDPARSRANLYFVYNNPDEKLLPFARSRKVLEEPGITKINLTTGPQAITGSTRMQATTIETFVVGTILEEASRRILARALPEKDLAKIGFAAGSGVAARLRGFAGILNSVKASVPALAPFTDMEAAAYAGGRLATYFAGEGLVAVFIDSTERSPTFRLFPLDTVKETRRKCWIQVWTEARDAASAWRAFLGRPFRGLDPGLYREPFEQGIEDPYLRSAALESLKKAGNDQAGLYDFSMSDFNLKNRAPGKGDVAVAVCLGAEADGLKRADSGVRRFLGLAAGAGAGVVAMVVADAAGIPALGSGLRKDLAGAPGPVLAVPVVLPRSDDPLRLSSQVAAKILLNAHSTAVMAKLGRVVGNTMTNVSPSNLKLVGRATYLIQSHVNDALSRPEWIREQGRRKPISYGEANAVLFDEIAFVKSRPEMADQTAEVALGIIRILESFKQKRGISSDEALALLRKSSLSSYLK